MAPGRRARPVLTAPGAEDQACPFCAGREHETPPEVDAIRDPGTAAGEPGWRIRAFSNLYPAATRHEVIAEGAEHTQQPSELPAALWLDALTLYQRRIHSIEADPQCSYAFLFKNVGQPAGASIAHNHSQILGLPFLPPRLKLEWKQARQATACIWCDEAGAAESEGRQVVSCGDFAAFSPRFPKLPYELWIAPRGHTTDFLQASDLDDLAQCLHALFERVNEAFGAPPFNLYLHRVPGADFHWHFELQPRTGNVAGLELGGDMYINSIPATDAAARLRGAS